LSDANRQTLKRTRQPFPHTLYFNIYNVSRQAIFLRVVEDVTEL